MKLIPSNGINIGQRAEQQDDFGFSDPLAESFVAHAGVLAVVVDGMGGVTHGAESARAAKAAFLQAYEAKSPVETVPQALERALHEANAAVLAIGRRYGDRKSVGATLTAAVVWRDQLTWISVGDSALFLLRNGVLQRLSTPHEISDPQQGEFVSSFLGLEPLTQIDRPASEVRLQTGDRVLVCTDGLFKSLPEPQITRTLGSSPPGQAGADLVDATIALGTQGQDNVTALVLSCEPDGTPSPITSTVPRRAPFRWGVAAALVVGAILLASAAVFGWYAYRSRQATTQARMMARGIQEAFDAAQCGRVIDLDRTLQSAPGASGLPPAEAQTAARSVQACTAFQKAGQAGDDAFEAASQATSATDRIARLQEAEKQYAAALEQGVPSGSPGSEPDRVKKQLGDARDARAALEAEIRAERSRPAPVPPPRRKPGSQSTDRAS